ncbi:MAG: HAD family hydrolase, partial [Deltaproteobacteria bacterium]|nr:HAD family hydrolase [Deltaproteobacteria bacterium]
MPYKLVIFDCDGVLFDSRQANAAFFNRLRTGLDLPPLTETEIDFVHIATTDLAIKRFIPAELYEQAQSLRYSIDYRQFNPYMIASPHLIELLEFLKNRYKIAICTNRGHSINRVLNDFGLVDYFDLVVSIHEVTTPKPDPEPVLLILDRLQVSAHEAIYVGDSENDAQAAKGAGVSLIAYKNPALDAEYYIDDLIEIKR